MRVAATLARSCLVLVLAGSTLTDWGDLRLVVWFHIADWFFRYMYGGWVWFPTFAVGPA